MGKLVNIVPDMAVMNANRKSDELEGVIKAMTSGDIMRVEEKYKPVMSVHPTARMVIATNSLPQFTDPSNGIYDRVRIIAFEQVIRGTKKQNPHLAEELRSELPGILLWALEGLGKLRKQRIFPESRRGWSLKEAMRTLCDPERTFLMDNVQANKDGFVPKRDLYDAYRNWCIAEGVMAKGPHRFFESVFRIFPGSQEVRRRYHYACCRVIKGVEICRVHLDGDIEDEKPASGVSGPVDAVVAVQQAISPAAPKAAPATAEEPF